MIEIKVLPFQTDLEWRLHGFVVEGFPIKLGEPRVVFDFIDAHDTKSFGRLAN